MIILPKVRILRTYNQGIEADFWYVVQKCVSVNFFIFEKWEYVVGSYDKQKAINKADELYQRLLKEHNDAPISRKPTVIWNMPIEPNTDHLLR